MFARVGVTAEWTVAIKSPIEMTDDEFCLYDARQEAAEIYLSEGFDDFAERVKLGLEDNCSRVRLARFFRESQPQTHEFVTAWLEMVPVAANEGYSGADVFARTDTTA